MDLSDVLHDLRKEPAGAGPAAPAPPIENVFKGLRDEAAHDSSPETAEQHFKLAGTYMDMGMQDEAMKALEVAARSPRHRFRAGAMLGKAYLDSRRSCERHRVVRACSRGFRAESNGPSRAPL